MRQRWWEHPFLGERNGEKNFWRIIIEVLRGSCKKNGKLGYRHGANGNWKNVGRSQGGGVNGLGKNGFSGNRSVKKFV